MKYISIIALLLTVCFLFAGCKDGKQKGKNPLEQVPTLHGSLSVETEPQEVTFTHSGVTVTLPGNFQDYTELPLGEQYTFLYAEPFVGLIGIEDIKEDLDDNITSLEAYAAYQASVFGGEAVEKDGLWTLVYEDLTQNEPQKMVCAFYETEQAYWMIQAYCTSDTFETHEEAMWSYVKAPTFE